MCHLRPILDEHGDLGDTIGSSGNEWYLCGWGRRSGGYYDHGWIHLILFPIGSNILRFTATSDLSFFKTSKNTLVIRSSSISWLICREYPLCMVSKFWRFHCSTHFPYYCSTSYHDRRSGWLVCYGSTRKWKKWARTAATHPCSRASRTCASMWIAGNLCLMANVAVSYIRLPTVSHSTTWNAMSLQFIFDWIPSKNLYVFLRRRAMTRRGKCARKTMYCLSYDASPLIQNAVQQNLLWQVLEYACNFNSSICIYDWNARVKHQHRYCAWDIEFRILEHQWGFLCLHIWQTEKLQSNALTQRHLQSVQLELHHFETPSGRGCRMWEFIHNILCISIGSRQILFQSSVPRSSLQNASNIVWNSRSEDGDMLDINRSIEAWEHRAWNVFCYAWRCASSRWVCMVRMLRFIVAVPFRIIRDL